MNLSRRSLLRLSDVVSFIVVALNILISLSLSFLVNFARYNSLTGERKAIVARLAITQFINTGILVVLINMRDGPASGAEKAAFPSLCNGLLEGIFGEDFACIFGEKGFFLRGSHFDLGPRWYRDVGASITLTLFIEMARRPLMPILNTIIFLFKRRCYASSVREVESMKALYTGPKPELHYVLGNMYSFAALCIVFSTLMPILHVVLFVYVASGSLVDRWYMQRICCTPAPYKASFIHGTLWWIDWALLLKLILAFWGFGSLPGISLDRGWELVAQSGLIDLATNYTDAAASAAGEYTDAAAAAAAAAESGAAYYATANDYLTAVIGGDWSDSWIANRTKTVGSLVILVAACLLAFWLIILLPVFGTFADVITMIRISVASDKVPRVGSNRRPLPATPSLLLRVSSRPFVSSLLSRCSSPFRPPLPSSV